MQRYLLGLFTGLLVGCAAVPVARQPNSSDNCQVTAGSFFQKKVGESTDTLFETFVKAGVSPCPLAMAAKYFDTNLSLISNRRFLVLVDFSKPLNVPRFAILNLDDGSVSIIEVSHGLGSDPNLDGHSTLFSDTDGSNMSALGFYLTADTYKGEYGHSLLLKGLSKSNRSSFKREIVMHPYPIGPGYNIDECKREKVAEGRPTSTKYCLPEGGLTRGCFGLPRPLAYDIIEDLKNGALMYAYSEGRNY